MGSFPAVKTVSRDRVRNPWSLKESRLFEGAGRRGKLPPIRRRLEAWIRPKTSLVRPAVTPTWDSLVDRGGVQVYRKKISNCIAFFDCTWVCHRLSFDPGDGPVPPDRALQRHALHICMKASIAASRERMEHPDLA